MIVEVKPVVAGAEELLNCCAVGNTKSKATWLEKFARPIPIASDTDEAVINQVGDLKI